MIFAKMFKININCIQIFSILLGLFFLGGCSAVVEHTPDSFPTVQAVSATSTVQIPLSVPTARTFEMEKTCSSSPQNGHIIFLQQHVWDGAYTSSNFDLLVMDGNGCHPKIILENVSGAPAWSTDGKLIAIGCENNEFVCVVAAQSTFKSCSDSEDQIGFCQPVILEKYPLPTEISKANLMYNISFSPDNTRLLVEGETVATNEYKLYILTRTGNGIWQLLLTRDWGFEADWSPVQNEILLSGISIISPDGNNKQDLVTGKSPEWAPNGRKIAFLMSSADEKKEPYGIALFDIEKKTVSWLYEPAFHDQYYWPPQNIVLGGSSGYSQALSWSPDEKFIAFVSSYQHGYDSQIFKLDTRNGNIVVLTANLMPGEEAPYCFSPAWGP